MSKILINTTGSDIDLNVVGLQILANNQLTIEDTEFLLLSSSDSIAELTPFINSGDVVVNDGINNLPAAEGIEYLKYPDDAFNIRFLSDPERTNGFVSKNVQEAIEEARNNIPGNFVADDATVSTSSSNWSLIGGMTLVAQEPGGYIAILEVDAFGDGANASGEIAIFKNRIQQGSTLRRHAVATAGISLATIEYRGSLVSSCYVEMNAGDNIQGGFRELNNDVFVIYQRSFHFIKVTDI